MSINFLLPLAVLALTQAPVYAQQTPSATMADELGTSLLVYLLIIAVYGLYWLKQKA